MVKTGQIGRPQGLDKLRRRVVSVKLDFFCFGTRFGCVKKQKLFITVFTSLHWVNQYC